jgi:predicted small lipoprotein YifL
MNRPDSTLFKSVLVAAALTVPLAMPLSSLAACGERHGPPSFEDFDKDGDGFVSEEEFLTLRSQRMAEKQKEGRPMKGAASAAPFSEIDTSGDGKLDRDEFIAGREAHMKMMHEQGMGHHQGMHHGKGMHHGEGMKTPTFADLDLNGDGCIDAEEFAKHHAEHHGPSE